MIAIAKQRNFLGRSCPSLLGVCSLLGHVRPAVRTAYSISATSPLAACAPRFTQSLMSFEIDPISLDRCEETI